MPNLIEVETVKIKGEWFCQFSKKRLPYKTDSTVPLARNFPITRACETSDGASLARNELHASLPLATDAPIISAFLLVCSRVNRESLAKYKFLKRYDAEKKLHCMKLQLIVV